MRDFIDAVRRRVLVYDGGMGATLEQFDLSLERDYRLPGRCHEALILNRPDVIEGVHASMLDAGADVLETDTFQASRLKLGEWGLADHTHEINLKAAEIARRAAGEERFVAGAIGPTGFLPASDDPTLGQISFAELVDVFTEQATGLIEGGVDLVIIETAQDILEVKAAVFGVRRAADALNGTGIRLRPHFKAHKCTRLMALQVEADGWDGVCCATAREAEVLAGVAQGLANKEIAARLSLSPRTVEKHVESLMRKMDTRTRTGLAAAAGDV